MRILPLVSFCLLVAALGCKGEESASTETTKAVSFSTVQPTLTQKCAGCHGANSPKGGVNLTSFEATMKGGEDGPIVKAGNAAGSELVQVMRGAKGHKKMPPQGPSVDEAQIKAVEAWIQAGAKA